MAASPARSAAFTILLRVERDSAYAVELLHSKLLNDLSPVDRNLTTGIVMGVLRWRSLLDEAIAGLVDLGKLDLEVLVTLRLASYRLAFLDRSPARAIVYESVELVKHAKKRSATGLVNAVLHKLSRNREGLLTSKNELASVYAHPQWLI